MTSPQFRVGDVVSLMRHALKSASYKPALLKALVRTCAKYPGPEIPLVALGEEFTNMYWNQTVIYHLRQAAALSKESIAVRFIRETAAQHHIRGLRDLPQPAREQIHRRMAKLLPINVLEAFHASKPEQMPRLYDWSPRDSSILVSAAAHAFLRENAAPLELIANYHWAEFLEGTNRLAPRIVQKVSRDAAKRASLQKYLRILQAESDGCFYCGCSFDDTSPTVDHVIPWTFLLEDPLWDLVLACARCNSAKSDWLPARDLLKRLLHRNQAADVLRSHVSFLIAPGEVERLYEAALSVEWPHFWVPR